MKTWHYEVLIAILVGIVVYLAVTLYPVPKKTGTFRGPTGAPYVKGPSGPPPN